MTTHVEEAPLRKPTWSMYIGWHHMRYGHEPRRTDCRLCAVEADDERFEAEQRARAREFTFAGLCEVLDEFREGITSSVGNPEPADVPVGEALELFDVVTKALEELEALG